MNNDELGTTNHRFDVGERQLRAARMTIVATEQPRREVLSH